MMRSVIVGSLIILVGLGAVLLLFLTAVPAGAPDVQGRAAGSLALRSSVVLVSYGGSPPKIVGAYCGGVIVGEKLVLTAFHCVRVRDDVYVETYSDRGVARSARVVWRRQDADLALLQADKLIPGRVAELAPDVAVNEPLILVGAPNSGTASVPFMLTRGVVGQILVMNFDGNPFECEKKPEPFGLKDHQVILTDAQAYFGNSGGGAFNGDGQLLGILVRGESATIDGRECDDYAGEAILWAYVVGLEELRKIPKP